MFQFLVRLSLRICGSLGDISTEKLLELVCKGEGMKGGWEKILDDAKEFRKLLLNSNCSI